MIGVNGLHSEPELMNLIDLISERHIQLRDWCEKAWNDTSEIPISHSEWMIMARIYKNSPTISSISKDIAISRQAVHKFIKKLEAKGLVEIKSVENNRKVKCLQLTKFGEACYEKNMAQKAMLEKQIADRIGMDQLALLKGLLTADWGV